MAAIRVHQCTKQFGSRVVLRDISLDLYAGQIVGLIGANGSGKTTLFRLMAGELESDMGRIERARSTEIGYLRQEPEVLPERTLHDEVISVFAGLLDLERKQQEVADRMAASPDDPRMAEWMEQYDRLHEQFVAVGGHRFEAKLNECLGGLGFTQEDYTLPMSALSGGQRCRARLAKLLLQEKPFLLLDEPTNHLDIDAVRWLEKFLTGHHGGAVIISHDRYLLDRLCTSIIELDRARIALYQGNYTDYAKTKKVQTLTEQRQFVKDKAHIEKERAFIAKHLAGQRTKEAQGRRTRLQRRLEAGEFVTEAPNEQKVTKLSFQADEARSGTVFRCESLTMAYGDRKLFDDLNLQIDAGQRLGITGPNGTGKSTLLKIALGRVEPVKGKAFFDTRRSLGYYAQDAAALNPQHTVLDEVRSARPDLGEQSARSILGSFRFTGDDVFKNLGCLSGGEQSRVRLACLCLQTPEVLVLDEPTNHLDIPSREVLEEALQDFPGTIIAVSHDRYFLDRIINRLLIVRPEGYTLHTGNYSSYLEQIEKNAQAARTSPKRTGGDDRRKNSKNKMVRSSSSAYDGMSLERIEEEIIQRENLLAKYNTRFGHAELYKDPDALAQLREQTETLRQELAELNEAWQQRVEGM